MFLEIKNIEKQYSNHCALNNVSMDIPIGSIYGLLGPNGAGKTTLIRIVTKIINADKGIVLFRGKPMTQTDVFRMGYLPEERGLYKKMRVWDHALFLAQLKGMTKKQAVAKLNDWFDRLEISAWKNKKVEELSKGMQQKVQFLTTVVHDPELLILDEPFSGFDPINAEILKNEIVLLKEQGKTIILSTHNMQSVEALCDQISLINQSQVVLQGNVASIKDRFKMGTLKLTIKGKSFAFNPTLCDIETLSINESRNTTDLRLKKHSQISNSDVIKEIADRYEIISCQEETPSMNDVFIRTVTTQ